MSGATLNDEMHILLNGARILPLLLADAELEVRFDLIDQLGIRELDIWVESVPDSWLPYLRKVSSAKTALMTCFL